MKIVTHNDRFHADDVCAMAALRIYFGDKITEVVRTRNESIIQTADIVFDVGHIYNPSLNRFDHHQTEGAGMRENGIPYASFGLVWKKFGKEICGSQEAADVIEKKLVQVVDAHDNGFVIADYVFPDVREYTISIICNIFGSTWKEEDNYDTAFFEVVEVMEKILRREIKIAQDNIEAIPFVEKAYQEAQDKRVVVLDGYYPWGDILSKYKDALFVVSPSKDGKKWRVESIKEEGFVNRKSFPIEWAGRHEADLERVTEVPGSLFCHRGLFLVVGNSKESAIQLAKIALES